MKDEITPDCREEKIARTFFKRFKTEGVLEPILREIRDDRHSLQAFVIECYFLDMVTKDEFRKSLKRI